VGVSYSGVGVGLLQITDRSTRWAQTIDIDFSVLRHRPLSPSLLPSPAQRLDGVPRCTCCCCCCCAGRPSVCIDDVDARKTTALIIARPIASRCAPEWRQRRRPGRHNWRRSWAGRDGNPKLALESVSQSVHGTRWRRLYERVKELLWGRVGRTDGRGITVNPG